MAMVVAGGGMLRFSGVGSGLMAARVVEMDVRRWRGRRRGRQAALFAQLLSRTFLVVVLRAASMSVGDRPLRGRLVHVAQQRDMRITQTDRRLGGASRRGGGGGLRLGNSARRNRKG